MNYLASPYFHPDPAVRQKRFEDVCKAASVLMSRGEFVFSPIAHSYPIAVMGALPLDFAYWEQYDREMLAGCEELWVLRLDGFKESKGVQAEIDIAAEYCMPVVMLNPEDYGLRS